MTFPPHRTTRPPVDRVNRLEPAALLALLSLFSSRLLLSPALLAAVLLPFPVRAQYTNTTCPNNSTTSFLFNSAGDSPCLAWSRIRSLCLSSNSYVNVPPLLDSTWQYSAPGSGSTICDCNVVSYALMAGCTYCQLGTVANVQSENDWASGCTNYTSQGLGFTEKAETIAAFAWNPWNGAQWDPTQASASASLYTAYPTETYTITLTRAFSNPTGLIASSASSTTSPTPSSSGTTNSTSSDTSSSVSSPAIGLIVGGTISGVVGLLIVVTITIQCWRSKWKPPNLSPTSPGTAGDKLLGGLGKKRESSWFGGPAAFADPRPAPRPDHLGGGVDEEKAIDGRYTTTSERLKINPPTASESDESPMGDRLQVALSPETYYYHSPDGKPSSLPRSPNPSPPSMSSGSKEGLGSDGPKSTPRPDYIRPYSDAKTLPSLYEPATGAPRWARSSNQSVDLGGERELYSPESRYPATEAGWPSRPPTAVEYSDLRRVSGGQGVNSDQVRSWYESAALPPLPPGRSDDPSPPSSVPSPSSKLKKKKKKKKSTTTPVSAVEGSHQGPVEIKPKPTSPVKG